MRKLLLLLCAATICSAEAADAAFEVQLTQQGSIEQVAMQADGKIFICGSFDFVAGEARAGVARLNPDGSLDRTFVPENDGQPIAITLDDAGVLVLENIRGRGAKLFRLDHQGRQTNGVSASFDWEIPVSHPGAVRMRKRADGSILIYGSNFSIEGKTLRGLAKLKADGSLDPSFSPPLDPFGFSTVLAVVENVDGTFWVANQRLHQIDAQGQILKTLPYSNVHNVVPVRNGKFLLGGYFPSIPQPPFPGSEGPRPTERNILRINPDGSEDTTYASPTNQLYQAGMHRLSDGRVLVMSYPPVILNPDGEPLRNINLPFSVHGYGPFAEQNGKFLMGIYNTAARLEEANFGLARLDRLFSLDATFSMPGGVTTLNHGIESLAAFADGSVIVAGEFNMVQGKSVPGIVKLTTTGQLDTNFMANLFAGTNSYTHELALEESGNLLIQGWDWSWNYSISTVERISSAGVPMGRAIEGAICDHFRSVHPLPQDHILITSMPGGPCHINGIINTDYRLFSNSSQFITNIVLEREIVFPSASEEFAATSLMWGGTMSIVTPAASNAFFIGGSFTHVNGVPRKNLAKVNISGEIDPAFELSASIPDPAAALRLGQDRFAVLSHRPWNGSAELIILSDTGTILDRFRMEAVDLIKAAHLRGNNELLILSISNLPSDEKALSLCTLSLTGELLRKVDLGSATEVWPNKIEPQMIVENSGSVLVAGAVSKPHVWSGIRRLSQSETSAFRLDVNNHSPDLHLKLRSPVGKTVRILKSHDLRNWTELTTITTTNSEPHEISYSSETSIFFRAEMD